MSNQDMNALSPDERIMAALAHGTILVPFMGVIAPIVIWVTQKDKSRFVRFQALQATVFQLTLVLIWFVGMACYMATFFISFFGVSLMGSGNFYSPALNGPGSGLEFLSFLIPVSVMVLVGIGFIVFEIYGIVGAVQALRGKAFRYIIISDRVDRFLQQGEQTNGQTKDKIL